MVDFFAVEINAAQFVCSCAFFLLANLLDLLPWPISLYASGALSRLLAVFQTVDVCFLWNYTVASEWGLYTSSDKNTLLEVPRS